MDSIGLARMNILMSTTSRVSIRARKYVRKILEMATAPMILIATMLRTPSSHQAH
jgi:hypothetical protein